MSDPQTPPSAEPSASRPPRVWLRLGVALGVLVVGLLVFGAVRRQIDLGRAAEQMRRVQDDLDVADPGWRMDEILAARSDPPPGKNSADAVAAAHRALGGSWPTSAFDGHFAHVRAPHRLDDGQRAALTAELKRVDAAVQTARRLAGLDRGRFPLTVPDNPWELRLEVQPHTRDVARLLQFDVLRLADAGDLDAALASCRAAVNAGRSLSDEPFLMSQLIRIAVVSVAAGAVEQALGQGEAIDTALAELQALLLLEEQSPDLLAAYRGERAMVHELFTRLIDGRVPLQRLVAEYGLKEARGNNWRAYLFGPGLSDVRRDYPVAMELMNRFVDATRLPAHEQAAALSAIDAELHGMATRRPLTSLLPPLGMAGEAHRRKRASLASLRVLLGVERTRLARGRWPARLEEVPAKLLPGGLPLDPIDGKPIRFLRTADGVTVYSVGRDGRDDGGKLVDADGQVRPARPGFDLGYRLWDVTKRRQAPLQPPPPPPDPSLGPPP